MATLKELLVIPNGASFYRADLHIHSYGASHDVRDAGMTPEAIVKTAITEGLAIIAITDHNEISNVEAAIKAAKGTDLLVIPAVELSTQQGHLLCYLPDFASLQTFYGRLTISDHGQNTSHCTDAMGACFKHLSELGGFGILAHVDGKGGFEEAMPGGNTPHRKDIIANVALAGIELLSLTSNISYSNADLDVHRAALGTERIKRLQLGELQNLARILSSDAHTLKRIGRNPKGQPKVTRVKMDTPSFDALRIALLDADARVRIEEEIPTSVPHIVGLSAEGGFLAGMKIHFSPNLNCIIGGRGTGKSTTFEGLRCLIAEAIPGGTVDSEVWPDKLDVYWQDQASLVHSLHRSLHGQVTNVDNPVNGPTTFPIESYGQGETTSISHSAKTDPTALLSYLDRFIDVVPLEVSEEEAREELLRLRSEIEEAQKKVATIPALERELATTEKQLAALATANAEEVIKLQRSLEDERELRGQIADKLAEMGGNLEGMDQSEDIEEIETLVVDPKTLAIGTPEFISIRSKAKAYKTNAQAANKKGLDSFIEFRSAIEKELALWKAKEVAAEAKIDGQRKKLAAQNIRLDMDYIKKLATDESRLKTSLKTLRAWTPRLRKLQKDYATISKRRWVARDRVAMARVGYAMQASETLRSVLKDLTVSLKFQPSSYSPDAEAHIISAMNWRTTQVPRASLMISVLTLPKLIEAVDKKDTRALASIKTPEGAVVFSAADVRDILANLSEPAVRFGLERSQVFDLPKLTVTGLVTLTDGSTQAVVKDFTKLSLGQQQSILLSLMLSSKSNAPLIIDQPEDHLDSEFIYRTLVPVLRQAKERRQVIIVTHNPNIAVLGDAEQIIVLKSTSVRSTISCRGSIDDPTTRDATCDVLEGAREAFTRRARIYGVAK